MNIGSEIYGKNELFERPVLILKMYSREMALVIPLTSKTKNSKFALPIQIKERKSFAILSQTRTLSTKRFSEKMGTLPQKEFEDILRTYQESII